MTTHSPRGKVATPSPYNLLELYREHRDEIDVLTDETALFILAFTDHIGTVTLGKLASDVNLSPGALRTKLTPLLRGRMLLESTETLSVTTAGKRLLSEIGFGTPPPVGPSATPKPSAPTQPQPPKFVRKPETPKPAATSKAKGSNCTCLGIIGCGGLLIVGIIVVLIIIAGLGPLTLPEEATPPRPEPPIRVITPIPACERMTEPEVVASSTYPPARVHVSWTVRGSCSPFQGTITARYTDQNIPYATYPITVPRGDLTDTPPTRCPREGTFTIVYTLTLRDRTGQSVTTTFEIPIRIIC
jgi:hypothetical protein